MDPVETLKSDASLFDAIRHIVEKQYVLVQAPDRLIVGIVTSSDLSVQFQSLTEPFLLLSELKTMCGASFNINSRQQSWRRRGIRGIRREKFSSVHDMNFGEYIALLEKPDNWKKLELQLDRRSFIDQLIRCGIRNDVMHFDPMGFPLTTWEC